MAVINTLEVKITGDSSDLQKKLRSSATEVAKWGAAAAAAAGAATIAFTSMGLKSVDALSKMSRAVDGSINSLQALKMAAGDTGLEGLESSLARMNRRLGAAEFGAGAAAVTVETLGLNLDELSSLDVDQRLQSIAKSMQNAGLSGEQMARHLQNLGFEQSQAVEFFTKGITSLEGYRREIDGLGLALTNIDAAKVEAANDAMGIFGDAVDAVSQTLAVKFSPLITAVSEQFQEAAMEAGGFGSATERAYEMAIKGAAFVIDSVDGIKRVFQISADWIIAAYSFVAEQIANKMRSVLELISKVPGVDFSEAIASLEQFSITSESVMNQAMASIGETLQRPMAGEKFQEFVEEAEIAAQEAAQRAVERTAEHQDKITEIEQQGSDARKKVTKQEWQTKEEIQANMLKNLSGLMNTESRKLFNIGKVSAISSALIEGYQAAVSSYKHGANIGGPILGAAYAATSALATGNLINNIKSQSFGGGGGGGGAVAATQGSSNVEAPAPSTGTLTVQGLSSDALFTGDSVSQIAEELLDYQRRGGQVLLA